jgi:Dirigent-like protein
MRRGIGIALAVVAGAMAASAVTAGVAYSALPVPATSGGQQDPSQTIRLFEHDTQQAEVDLGDHGAGPGDLFVFAGDVTDTSATGPKLGRAYGSCATASGDAKNPGTMVCTITFGLQHGQIETQAVFDSGALFGGTALPMAITGGTGDYRDARGEGIAQVPDVNDPASATFVLSLRS